MILIAVLFCKVSGHEFLINWDDVDYITQNPVIRDITVANLKHIFFSPFNGIYAPLHILSYMFHYAIWGLNPAAFKIINVVLHAACAILFYRLPYLLQLVKNYSGSEAAHLYLGINYGMTGEKESVAELFRIVIRINPENKRALKGLNDVMSTPVFEISTDK